MSDSFSYLLAISTTQIELRKVAANQLQVCVLSILSVSATRRRLTLIFWFQFWNPLRKKLIFTHMDQSTLSMGCAGVYEFGDLQWGPTVTRELMELTRVLGRRKPLNLPWNTLVYIFHVVDDENEAQRSEWIKASKRAQSRFLVSLVLSLCQWTFMEHSVWAGWAASNGQMVTTVNSQGSPCPSSTAS